ncbi:hypothetical protein PR048_023936 [Dryococelus australis]|uniref:Uncharacterized protein n=1 Tax=Dryococelus australis TaxID=614101 RepID=A0ABQ9GVF4_9NEOP|nr:hypothetical protein PR048_023936 [Dryococelus australis]
MELIKCSYEELIKVLDTHLDPKKNEIAACFVLANRRQQHTETISEFVAELKRLSREAITDTVGLWCKALKIPASVVSDGFNSGQGISL